MRQFVIDRRREAILVPVLVLGLGLITYVATRLYATYNNAASVALLSSKVDTIISDRNTEKIAIRTELDEMNRTLYEAIIEVQNAKPPVRRPSSTEQWVVNRMNLLQKRIETVERRLYQLEK